MSGFIFARNQAFFHLDVLLENLEKKQIRNEALESWGRQYLLELEEINHEINNAGSH